MKNENEFNRYLSKEFKKFSPSVFSMKVSDRFHAGVSDFLLWRGKTLALEVKFVKEIHDGTKPLLKHPFTGPQLTFMENITIAGNEAGGLVADAKRRRFWYIPYRELPTDGNWEGCEFKKRAYAYASFEFCDVSDFVKWVFYGAVL